mmetsp:Transcript_73756/g.116309  ORF Transcript_73756/g.116309 Transcript_73756/m.116309 type:complete len:267 (-) Transcript_73756:300-1100(-)
MNTIRGSAAGTRGRDQPCPRIRKGDRLSHPSQNVVDVYLGDWKRYHRLKSLASSLVATFRPSRFLCLLEECSAPQALVCLRKHLAADFLVPCSFFCYQQSSRDLRQDVSPERQRAGRRPLRPYELPAAASPPAHVQPVPAVIPLRVSQLRRGMPPIPRQACARSRETPSDPWSAAGCVPLARQRNVSRTRPLPLPIHHRLRLGVSSRAPLPQELHLPCDPRPRQAPQESPSAMMRKLLDKQQALPKQMSDGLAWRSTLALAAGPSS